MGLIKGGDPTDNININKRMGVGGGGGVQIKDGGLASENCSRSKIATRYH